MPSSAGKVYLVGAGPGDPGLITLRGCRCLAQADVVLYDYLVNPRILDHTRACAQLVCLGRHGRGRIVSQDEINRRMIELARDGKTVVRLKAGDPVVFARAAEEIAALESADVAYEIVPGITAALAVGSYTGIPLTQGDAASAVALVTGQERRGKDAPGLDYAALASFPGTLVFYMGVTTVAEWTGELIRAGKPHDTPAAIVRRCAWPDQEVIYGTLGTLTERAQERHLRPPALFVVGQVAALRSDHGWFVDRPLFGKRVLVTRPSHQSQALATLLDDLGAGVVLQPAIEILPPDDWTPVDRALDSLADFDWLVFSSANGVRAFLDRLLETRDLRALGQLQIAAIGPGTADELARYHLRADLVPDEYRAEALAETLKRDTKQGARVLLVRASRGREVLAEELSQAGCHVEQVVTYLSRDVTQPDPGVAELLSSGQIDWITVTSSAIARSLAKLFGEKLRQSKLASISPVTSAALRELGYEVSAEAVEYTMPGLVDAILAAQADRRD